jgi:cell division protein FtsB
VSIHGAQLVTACALLLSIVALTAGHMQLRAELEALDTEVGELAREVSQLRGLVRVCCAP